MLVRIPTPVATIVHEIEDGGDIVLFDQKGNRLLLLNDIGAAVWLLLDGVRSVAEIARLIIETLPADRSQVERDVQAFVENLASHGVIELR